MTEQQRKQLEADIAWHRNNLTKLERDKTRMPWLLLIALLAIPVGIKWGALPALATVGFAVFFAVAGFYLVGGHRQEYEQKIRDLEGEIATLEGRAKK